MQIFIIAAEKDGSVADQLAERLRQAGLRVWTPSADVFPGDNLPKKVGEALEASDAIVVLITPNANKSAAFVREIQFVISTERYAGRVIPVLIGATRDVPNDVPWILMRLAPVYVDDTFDGLNAVVARLHALAGSGEQLSGRM